ncbi:MAG: hypothetical protein A2X59_08235 [Nitrospirae bacterium GWC2_42_7]|nr:MAG: hypothetical protein A2X59_08235 [Nitrospirae bacterium GWC2_42_7]
MTSVRGKSLKALAFDVSEGYAAVNPIFLKSFDNDVLKDFYKELSKAQNDIRGESFPAKDTAAIRTRNLKLQRLFSATMIIRHYAKGRRIPLI